MILLRLVFAFLLSSTVSLLPLRGPDDLAHRSELVDAAIAVTDVLQEQLLLVAIPRWEASYRRDVADCRLRGPQGEVGPWQVLPRNDAERLALCVSLEGDARIALARIRESLSACRSLPPAERLALYARGRCSSSEGRRLSRVRWVSAPKGGSP